MCNCDRFGTDEQEKVFFDLLKKNKGKSGNIMPVLQKTEEIFGYIPEACIKHVSKTLDLPESKIYGIITFYSQFSLTPRAKYNINVCLGTACFVLGAQTVLDKVLDKLKVKPGQMTEDGKWIVTTCRCLGCCGLAPVLTINGEVYGNVKISDIDRILDSYKD